MIQRVICLVRAEDDGTARARVGQALEQRGLEASDELYSAFGSKADEGKLGLSEKVYEEIADQVDVVIHVSCLAVRGRRPSPARMLNTRRPGRYISRAVSARSKAVSKVRDHAG